MNVNRLFRVSLLTGALLPAALLAQSPAGHTGHDPLPPIAYWFGLLELPFLLVCVWFSFRTAAALKGGLFGKGMQLLAWGFLVMAVGHLVMQLNHFYHYDLFASILGQTGGTIAWFLALVMTWGLSAFGFYKIYSVSKK